MKFTFSSRFRQSLYQQLLHAIAAEIDTYRQINGITVKELMSDLHISHPIVRKC
jgi:hypothetical protein